MRNFSLSAFLLLGATLILPPFAASQQEGDDIRAGALTVYLECAARGCESSHYRTEITYVNWVRELQDAQLHIIMTQSGTGGGDVYTLDFIGREDLAGADDQLTYSHSDADTDFQRSQGITGVLSIGLARYALLAGQDGPFTVVAPTERDRVRDLPPGLQGEVVDPWDYWVFEVGGSVNFEDQDRKDERRLSANFSANRTTEMWKVSLTGRGSFSDETTIKSDGSEVEDQREEGSADGRIFYSLAERWSIGMEAGASTSTSRNQELAGQVGAGIEYSFFPYRDWTRRSMVLRAMVYARYFDYDLITQFDKLSETLPEGSLQWGVGFRQPWGNANINATAEAYLNNPTELYRLSFGGSFEVRIARGLQWRVSGSISKIRDQIYIPLDALSDEDVLLGRRQLPTNSSLNLSTGFSFNFGSIYNNVVNNRFGWLRGRGRGGGGGFF